MYGDGILSVLFSIFVVIVLIANVAAKGKQKGQMPKARREHLMTIGNDLPKRSMIDSMIEQNKSAVVDKPVVMSKRHRLTKLTNEKTHDHEGELRIEGTGLMEDRQNDWLAKQIREEARLFKRLM